MVFVGVAGFIAYSLINDSNKKYYITTRAETMTIDEKLHLSGFVYPSKEIEIKPQLSGVVDNIFIDVGDFVKEGDPIASITLVPNAAEVEQLQSAVNVARINLDMAKANYERERRLIENDFISKVEFEAAEKEFLSAQENYNLALRQRNLRVEGTRSANNVVRATTSGVAIDVPVKTGSSVVERSNFNAGTTIAIIAGADKYLFKTSVSEKDIGKLHTGMPVSLILLAIDSVAIDAVIVKISAIGEKIGGAVKFPVEAEFSVEDKRIDLRSGYSASAEILLSSAESVISLPENCVHFKGDTSFVFVTDSLGRSASEKIVSLGFSDGERVQIVEGISEGDRVITNYYD